MNSLCSNLDFQNHFCRLHFHLFDREGGRDNIDEIYLYAEFKEWIILNRFGRRNMNDLDWKYHVGSLYNIRKKKQGEHKGNQYTSELESGQNVHSLASRRISQWIRFRMGGTDSIEIKLQEANNGTK